MHLSCLWLRLGWISCRYAEPACLSILAVFAGIVHEHVRFTARLNMRPWSIPVKAIRQWSAALYRIGWIRDKCYPNKY